jgi:sigma-B regulation protein RsbU (phosphoserine phosphatase)
MEEKPPSAADQLARENLRLRRAVEELSILNEIATAINSTLSLDRILSLTLQKCMKHLNVEQGAILLLDEHGGDNPFRTKVRKADTDSEALPFRLNEQLAGWMLKYRRPLMVQDLVRDERFQLPRDQDVPIHSLLGVPLMSKGRMIGLLALFNKKKGEIFTEDNQRLLSIIAAQAAQVIENNRLFEEEQALRRMQEELRLAYELQVNLLPKLPPAVPGYDIAGRSQPARQVGGDYFDFIEVRDGHLALCLGDATGKGMPAAMLMANLQATVRGQARVSRSVAECLQRANTLLYHSTSDEKYATLFFGCLDVAAHRFCYANAGHCPPILVDAAGNARRLAEGGIVLGCIEEYAYPDSVYELQPGDVLMLFSDGVTEAMDGTDEEFGEFRLESIIRDHRGQAAAELIDTVFRAVCVHAGNRAQADDMTAVVIKRRADGA